MYYSKKILIFYGMIFIICGKVFQNMKGNTLGKLVNNARQTCTAEAFPKKVGQKTTFLKTKLLITTFCSDFKEQ